MTGHDKKTLIFTSKKIDLLILPTAKETRKKEKKIKIKKRERKIEKERRRRGKLWDGADTLFVCCINPEDHPHSSTIISMNGEIFDVVFVFICVCVSHMMKSSLRWQIIYLYIYIEKFCFSFINV